ncbi:MAG: hypothetical protein FWC15_01435 [Fibromonadales bacterium]|nr:hypothetical protein [Fibromonadales bacterium]
MRLPIFLIFFCFAIGFAQQQPAAQDADTSSANQAVFADVSIFAQMPIGAIYILWSNYDEIADIVKTQIMSRNFVLEPYFMQNIDREQFEQNQILHLFSEQRKAFFKLFPDEEED